MPDLFLWFIASWIAHWWWQALHLYSCFRMLLHYFGELPADLINPTSGKITLMHTWRSCSEKKMDLVFSYSFLVFGWGCWSGHVPGEDWWAISWDVALQSPLAGACAVLGGISSQERVGRSTGANADYSRLFAVYYVLLQAQPVGAFVSALGSYSSLKVLNNENKNGLRATYLPVFQERRGTHADAMVLEPI